MTRRMIKKRIYEFFNIHELGVISTIHCDKNAPESALVGFGHDTSLNILFGTSNTSRKYANLQKNSFVSFVIGGTRKLGTVQYEGVAREILKEEVSEFLPLLIQKNIDNKSFVAREEQRYFLVTPLWIRFLDNAGKAPGVYEVHFKKK